jgi:hypothetical protein
MGSKGGNDHGSQLRASRNAALRAIREGNEEEFQRVCRKMTVHELRQLRGDAAKLSSELTGIIGDRFTVNGKENNR